MEDKESGDASSNDCQWLEKVFCNSIMLKKIVIYLSLEDINSLRCASPALNNEILSCKRFKNNAVFVVCQKSVQTGVLNHCEIKWKNVKIELYDGIGSKEEDKKNIRELLDNHVEFLHLTGNSEYSISFLDRSYNEAQKLPLFMDKIQKTISFKNLTALHIHSYILNGLKFRESPFLTDTLFKNLKALKLYYEQTLKLYNPPRETDNLAYISETCKSLVEFSVERIVESHIDGPLAKKSIIDILSSNASALTSLYVDDESMWSLKEITELRFPVLKHCGIRCMAPNQSHALTFLMNLNPNVESLSVSFKGYMPIPILQAIRDKSKGLKKLHVKASQLGDNDNDYEKSQNLDLWTFLHDMDNLEDFSLTEPCNSQFTRGLLTYQCLLRNLPRNLQNINIRGLVNEEMLLSVFPTLAFENLTVLNLLRLRNCLDNTDMQHICSKMTNLVQLMFSHAEMLADFGITGISIDEQSKQVQDSGISIKNLKGLKFLTIRECELLTTAIFGSIVFKFLTDLNLGNNIALNIANNDGYPEKLVAQNPLLKRISLSHNSGLDVEMLVKEFADVSGGRCSLSIVDNGWPTCDSDIDAEDEDEYANDHDSDFSGGGYNEHQNHHDFGFSDEDDDDDDDDRYDY